MRCPAGIGFLFVILACARQSLGQPAPPISDKVETPLLPSGVTEYPVSMNGPLVYRYKSEEGLDVLHFAGDFLLTLEGEAKQEIRSKEAIVWLGKGITDNRSFKYLQIYLYRDAEISQL